MDRYGKKSNDFNLDSVLTASVTNLHNGGGVVSQSSDGLLQRPLAKRKFILRRRVDEEEARASKKLGSNTPMGGSKLKRSFQQVARLAQAQVKISNSVSLKTGETPVGGGGTNGTTGRGDTIYSQKSNHQEFLQKALQSGRTKSPPPTDENYIPEVKGPSVQLNKRDVSLIIDTGLVAFEEVTVFNNGSASIYYEWKKIEVSRAYSASVQDPEQKFFCHHERSVIKPGQSKRFMFAFISQVTGIFSEEWELKCEPPTIPSVSVPRLKLTGNAIDVDELKEWRSEFDSESLNSYLRKGMLEIIEDILDNVRSPPPPPPDISIPEIACKEFEAKNVHLNLWYNPLVMKWWYVLRSDLLEELHIDASTTENSPWDLNIKFIKDLIEMVEDEDKKLFFESRYNHYVELCRKRPIERSEIFAEVRSAVQTIAQNIPETSDKVREEIGMWESVFRPPKDDRDFTEAEGKALEDEKTKIKNEWIKKTKKKKWEKEDDAKMNQDYRAAIGVKLKQQFNGIFDGFEEREAYQRVLTKVESRQPPSAKHFENLLRKKHLKEIDVDGKRVLLRAHLKLSSAPDAKSKQEEFKKQLVIQKEEELKRIEEEKLMQEKQAKDKKKPVAVKKPVANAKGKAAGGGDVNGAGLDDDKPKERVIDVSFLDEDCLNDIVEGVKHLFERQARLIVLLVSYDEKLGEFNLTSSLQFLSEYLRTQIENTVTFNTDSNSQVLIENFAEKIEMELFPDNSVLLLENAYFSPEEIGFELVTRTNFNEDGEAEEEDDDQEEEQEGVDKKKTLKKYTLEDKKEFIEQLSQYGNSLIIDDKENIFSRCTSLVNLHCENIVLGPRIAEDLQFVGHMMTFEKPPFHALIGGDISAGKLLAIDTLASFVDVLVLLGTIGVKFLVVQQEILAKNSEVIAGNPESKICPAFPGFAVLNKIEKRAIEALLKKFKSRGKDLQVILPKDFLIVPDVQIEGVERMSPVWIEKQITGNYGVNFPALLPTIRKSEANISQAEVFEDDVEEGAQNQSNVEVQVISLDYSSAFPQGHVIVDFGEATQDSIRNVVRSAKKLLWIDSLSLIPAVEHSNAANIEAGRALAKIQREKRERLETIAKNNPEYEFDNDLLVFAAGKSLAKSLMMFDLNPIEKKLGNAATATAANGSAGDEIHEDDNVEDDEENGANEGAGDEEDNRSMVSGMTAAAKSEAIRAVSDFFVKDLEFVLRIVQGEPIDGITAVESYEPIPKDELNDDLDFLDNL